MADHPIQGLMKTAMENIKQMVEVNTIVGDPVETPDGSVILPVSRVGFGFAAGGSEFSTSTTKQGTEYSHEGSGKKEMPFGGGSGGGVSITPIAFLVVNTDGVKLLNLDRSTHLYDRLIDLAPGFMEKIQGLTKKKGDSSEQQTTLQDL